MIISSSYLRKLRIRRSTLSRRSWSCLWCVLLVLSNLLDAGENNCARLVVEHPVLTPEELAALQDDRSRDGWSSATVDATLARDGADQPHPSPDQYGQGSDSALERALADLCERAARAVQGSYGRDGAAIIVLSDALAGPDRLPIPTLAVGAVHQHLLKTGQRGKAALFADCGDVKEVHDVALAVGFGADGVCPRVAYEALAKLRHDGLIHAKMRNDIPSPDDVPDSVEIKFPSHAIDGDGVAIPRHRRDVVPVAASARWRGFPRRSTHT